MLYRNALTKFEPLSVVVEHTLLCIWYSKNTELIAFAKTSNVCFPFNLRQASAADSLCKVSWLIQWAVIPK